MTGNCDFPNVKIAPLRMKAVIEYDLECDSQDQLTAAKEDFEQALESLRQQGGAVVKWKPA